MKQKKRMQEPKKELTLRQYKNLIEKSPVITVDILFFDKSFTHILLFRRKNEPFRGGYFSCGGRLLKNEDFVSCAIRKSREEVGIEIGKSKFLYGGVINEIWPNSKFIGINYHCVNIYFGSIIENPDDLKLRLDDQHDGFKWFSLQNRNIHPFIREKIKNTLQKYVEYTK